MHLLMKRIIRKALRGCHFLCSVDLGCGNGDGGLLLKPHTDYLIGIDWNPMAIKKAEQKGVYDELHVCDLRSWQLNEVDSIFLFDVLEHLSKPDGHTLLNRFRSRFVMVSTPWWSLSVLLRWSWDGHQCIWTREELRRVGFAIPSISQCMMHSFIPDIWGFMWWGGFTLGVREPVAKS